MDTPVDDLPVAVDERDGKRRAPMHVEPQVVEFWAEQLDSEMMDHALRMHPGIESAADMELVTDFRLKMLEALKAWLADAESAQPWR